MRGALGREPRNGANYSANGGSCGTLTFVLTARTKGSKKNGTKLICNPLLIVLTGMACHRLVSRQLYPALPGHRAANFLQS